MSKAFTGVQALRSVSLEVAPGDVHALVGENGAGKSTLVKIIAGFFAPDAGTIEVGAAPVTRFTPRDAAAAGVALVAQEPEHFVDLTALENLFVGTWPAAAAPGSVSWREMESLASGILDRMGARLDLRARMGDLPLVDRQMIQIGRALLQDARVLILDEPTAALGQAETEALFSLMRTLAERGVSIIYISHRLEEIFEIADRVTVLRDGRVVASRPIGELSREDIVRSMVGSEVAEEYEHVAQRAVDRSSGPVLTVQDLSSGARFREVSLDLFPGEVLGLAGLAGSGRNELLHALAGALRSGTGQITIDGSPRRIRRPADARALGMILVPGDRPGRSLVLPMTVRENITLSSLAELSRGPFTDVRREAEVAEEYVRRLDIRTPSVEQPVMALSGGNQQKTALARRMACRPRVLLLEEPTQGVDVGARAEIHALMRGLVDEGLSIILLSSDLNELLALSDRVAVMHRGRLAGVVPRAEATKERVLGMAFGQGVGKPGTATGFGREPGPELEQDQRNRWLSLVFRMAREVGLVAFLLAACVALALASDEFVTAGNFREMAQNSAYLLVAALGMAMVILTGGIDISVGSALAVCCIVAGQLATSGMPLPVVILGTLGAGAALGFVNAAGIAWMGLPPIIMTLATLTIYRGLVVGATGGRWISGLPSDFSWLGKGMIGPIPVPMAVALVATAAVALVLARSGFGRSLYAIGNNASAAEHLGVSVRRTRLLVYTLCGAMVGLSALTYAPRFTTIQTNTGIGFEMVVVTAAVVGGTNIFGGRGTVLGTVLGVVLLQVIGNGLDLLATSETAYWEKALQGTLVLLAVMTDFITTRRRNGEGR